MRYVESNMPLSRREFLLRVGQAGGYGAAFLTMQGLGLAPARAERVPAIAGDARSGKGKRVAVLGGGIAGLVAAYELRALGFTPVVLEARGRPGGRNWTVRGGDAIDLIDGAGQTCQFSPGLYQNAGPARLPSVHTTMLGYCRKLGVPMEVEVNSSRGSMLQNDVANAGAPVTQRKAVNDTRGHVSELLMKSLKQGELDADLTPADREQMLDFLRFYGPLDNAGVYKGSDRAGYSKLPGAGDDAGVLADPLDMHTLLNGHFWNGMMFTEAFDQQATMFQPVGGMDRIAFAFARELGPIVHFNAPVTEIRRTGSSVRIGYTEAGKPRQLQAEFCICALPLTMLRLIPNDFAPAYQRIITEAEYAGAYKFCWESRRFWEQDENIYGGLEFVAQGPSPVWLPSAGFFSDRGVLVSGYTFSADASFDKLDFAGRAALSRASVEKLHPGKGHELEKPLHVPWAKVRWNEGSWIQNYGKQPDTGKAEKSPGVGTVPGGPGRQDRAQQAVNNPQYETLITPDGPFFFAGDHCCHIVAWQEGAALSAKRAVGLIVERVQAAG